MFKQFRNHDEGFSMIEIVVSIAVLAIAMTAVYRGLTDAVTKNYEARDLQKATFEAESVLETLQAEGITYQASKSDVERSVSALLKEGQYYVEIDDAGSTAAEDAEGNVTGGYDLIIEHWNREKTEANAQCQFRLCTFVPAASAADGGEAP